MNTFFPTVEERSHRYTDVWVVGASAKDVEEAVIDLFPDVLGDDNTPCTVSNGFVTPEGVVTFDTEYTYVYVAQALSAAIPNALVFTKDDWDGFGFAAYKNGRKFTDYIVNLNLSGVCDIDKPWEDEPMYEGDIVICRKDDGKKMFTIGIHPTAARYIASLVKKTRRGYDVPA